MEVEELVSGEGWISDDSSFYGDEDEQERLLSLCEDYRPKPFWTTHQKDLNVVIAKKRTMPPAELFNPGEGQIDHWQLGESTDDFVKRLPPLTTSVMTHEWIWVNSPYPQSHRKSGPFRTVEFKSRGSQLLVQSLQTRNDIQTKGAWKAKGMITRMLNQESKLLQQRITDLAVETNVLSGKWMLFPEVEDMTRVWRLVVEGVIHGRLGSTAKVAPDNGGAGARLICVYTKDYRDKEDILRVLRELVSMGVAGTGRPIYYKTDPYTLLGIYQNSAAEYGLQASLYSSQKMLAEAGLPRSAPPPRKQQSTLSGIFKSPDSMDVD